MKTSMRLGHFSNAAESVKSLDRVRFAKRLLEKDATLWKTGKAEQEQIRNSLGWLAMPEVMSKRAAELTGFAEEIRREGFTHAVLLGMGGSSLAPLVMYSSFGHKVGNPELIVLDSTDPGSILSVDKKIDIQRTLFIVSSKSGSTIEPLSFFEYFYAKLHEIEGEGAGRNFIAITDPGTALEGFARKYKMRRVFTNFADIGGRYSALSYFGLVPAAVIGMDIKRLLSYALLAYENLNGNTNAAESAPLALGAALGALAKLGRDKITFFASKELASFGLWIEQLIAESTGKEGTGIVPIAGEPVGAIKAFSTDRVFAYIGLGEPDDKLGALLDKLDANGNPVLKFILDDLYEMGGEFFNWEVATAVAGHLLGINPFDQPDVEIAKLKTVARLGEIGKKSSRPPGVEVKGAKLTLRFGDAAFNAMKKNGLKKPDVKKAMSSFMGLVNRLDRNDYFGLLSYTSTFDGAAEKVLVKLRKDLRDAAVVAVQSGYGPRYLHSTGQIHKGGPNTGVFFIIAHKTPKDVEIPGKHFGFAGLVLSQAYGDMEALDSKGRRVVLIELKDQSVSSFKEAASVILNAAKGAGRV